MARESSTTQMVECPACKGDDCCHTVFAGEFAGMEMIANVMLCNSCGHYTKKVRINGQLVSGKGLDSKGGTYG